MLILDYISNTFTMMKVNKLRTVLSMLGIVIGIFSVIVMLAIGQGTQEDVLERFNSFGANLVSVTPWVSDSNVRFSSNTSSSDLLDEDLVAFLQEISGVEWVSPQISARKQAIYTTNNSNVNVIGILSNYFSIKNLTFVQWNIFDEDTQSMQMVAILGKEIATTLFGVEDPVGKELKLENMYITVIWVLDENSQADNSIFVPLKTMENKIAWTHYYNSIDIAIEDVNQVVLYKNIIHEEMKSYFGVWSEDDVNWTVSTLQEILSSVEEVTGMMKTLLAGIAAISLLVGGIGVMNIMLVSVTERTRDIGIRKAIGAERKDIMIQFLTEAVILTVIAGSVWVLLSFGVVHLLTGVISAVISRDSVIVASASSVGIGILFGILPAYKWAKLKPIDALRYE